MNKQIFIDTNTAPWQKIEQLPGTEILPLCEPVSEGSIHRLKIAAGSIIPVHIHPCDEYVYVLNGNIETDGHECKQGTFWFTPAGIKNGPHRAITDVEIMTVRLGKMGVFE
ncbi:MAG: DUF4437 domain-containing protein [Cyanobacteria bacterium P01_A01_bin.84]